jgi:hypothetical protein
MNETRIDDIPKSQSWKSLSNFGTIILLPKSSDAKQIRQYRPNHLLNVSFKSFTKVATNMMALVAKKVICP